MEALDGDDAVWHRAGQMALGRYESDKRSQLTFLDKRAFGARERLRFVGLVSILPAPDTPLPLPAPPSAISAFSATNSNDVE